ncbi:MAG: NADP-dependent phosphogluconate dehydrogenase, partial [Rhizobium sp.]|nr:NADP-dependent phosphogluconate dehydrogenase [Rhizobium sp.]
GDIVIDAGNANFRDTIARFDRLKDTGLTFIGMGVSGGEEGARHGPSIMVGGTQQSYARVEKVLTSIAARYQGDPCCAWLGEDGAGHFVKTIHNGIEYADMQMIAEIYGVLRDGLGKSAGEIGAIFGQWNRGRLNSYLIEITEKVLTTTDPETGRPMVDMILDRAGQKGTGKWSAIEAQQMGVPATAIEAAVAARSLSSMKAEREAAETLFGTPSYSFPLKDGAALMSDLELALFAAKIGAYAQGFAVMAEASREFGWSLPMPTIARIWRAGCIIRSQFLDEITKAFTDKPDVANLIVTPAFSAMVAESLPALRRVVAAAVTAGIPVPALASALSYFDAYRQARGTANLIQAQRDFFGAHGFDRIDGLPIHHGPWSAGN